MAGGWGEDFSSCYDRDYALEGAKQYGVGGSSIVQTSWALLALIETETGCENDAALQRGCKFLMDRQVQSGPCAGDWPQEGISGVFNRSCGISYTQYRNIFPIWALGAYARRREQQQQQQQRTA